LMLGMSFCMFAYMLELNEAQHERQITINLSTMHKPVE